MSIAAVPSYLGQDFKDASPGMRFGMYLKCWEGSAWAKIKGKTLDAVKRLNANDKKTMQALLHRQQQAFDAIASADASLRLDALATAPFTTGLGNEHPLENGFAFLNPYGLPYLPGSGVKGVLRQAARELTSGDWGDAHDVLFGRETGDGEKGHLRGALTFWDVIPQIAPEDPKKPDQISLAVDIMTPHQSHYYQQNAQAGSTNPHDSGQPVPISFLTVPPGSGFAFHVVCDLAHLNRLAPTLAEGGRWKELLTAAFEHAFDWLGFGAKTAVGYGAMHRNQEAEQKRQQTALEAAQKKRKEAEQELLRQEHAARLAQLNPLERQVEEFLDQRPDKQQSEIASLVGALKQNRWEGDERRRVAMLLKQRMEAAKEWKPTSQKKNPAKDKEHQNTLLVQGWIGTG